MPFYLFKMIRRDKLTLAKKNHEKISFNSINRVSIINLIDNF